MISSLRPVSIIERKMFLSNQIKFLYMCEPNLTNIYHIKIIFLSMNTYIILNSCWYNSYVNPADLFNNIFPLCKLR